jgi:hypothetical protein
MVGQNLGAANGGHALTPHYITLILNREQCDGSVIEDRQVVLTELCEGLVDSPLQSVIKVVAPSRGEPSHHGRVGGVSQDVHVDLAVPKLELMVWVTTICRSPCLAKAV